MMPKPVFANLRAAQQSLRSYGVIPGVSAGLLDEQDALAETVFRAVWEQVPAYAESGNPELAPELRAHLAEIVREACRLLGGQLPGSFDFVLEHARARAAQKFPLDAVLHAYRCTHRVLANRIRDAALETADASTQVRRVVAATSDFTMELSGAMGTVLTAEYVAHTRILAKSEGDRRMRLMDTLLGGYDESDQVAARLLRRAGYLLQRQSYCVAIACAVNAREMEHPARAERMADAVAAAFSHTPLRALVGIRDNRVIAILSGTRRLSGWTAPESSIADRAFEPLRQIGPAALIGLSNDVPSTSHIPRAASEAMLALDFADVAHRVMRYAEIPFQKILVTQAREAAQSALPAWLDAFVAGDTKARGALSATLSAYADADMNALRAAKSLGIHPNTIYSRMQKIRDLTAMDPLRYHALSEMLLVLECRKT